MRILVQNGLALFNTWLTVASAIGFCELITYKDSPAESQAALRGQLALVAEVTSFLQKVHILLCKEI